MPLSGIPSEEARMEGAANLYRFVANVSRTRMSSTGNNIALNIFHNYIMLKKLSITVSNTNTIKAF